MARPVIISACGPALMPLWRPLSKDYDLVMTLNHQAEQMRAQWGVNSVGLITFATPAGQQEQLQNYLWPLAVIDWDGANSLWHWPGWEAQPEKWLLGHLADQLIKILPQIQAADNLKKQRDVAGVLLHEDVTCETNWLAQWAQTRDVPSVHVAHGSYVGEQDLSRRHHEAWDVHSHLHCDVICTWNERQRDLYLRNGAKPEQVIVTGSPMEDKWMRVPKGPMAKAVAKAKLGFNEHDKVVLCISSFALQLHANDMLHDYIAEHLDLFLEAMKLLPEWKILISAHPGRHMWTAEWHAEQLKRHGLHGNCLVNTMDLCGQAADVAFDVAGSLAAMEISLLDVATVRLNLPHDEVLDTTGCCAMVDMNPQAIAAGLKAAWRKPQDPAWQEARNKFVYDSIWIPDGKATERVLGVIRERFKCQPE